MSSPEATTVFRTCPFCEATCGLELTIGDGAVTRIRGDRDDVFSRGFICPKGTALGHLHDDPDRLHGPLVRRDGELRAATWEEAFAEVARRLPPIIQRHGRDTVAVYVGNPTVHNLSGILYSRLLLRALGTRNVFTASTVDQRPKEISSALLFGTMVSHPVPDLDRTSYLLLLGANPLASNGSLATAPDWPGRLRRILERGGAVVVVDPKRTRTAERASEHLPIRPGTDAQFLMAVVHTLFAERLVDLGDAAQFMSGVEVVEGLARDFTPEAVAPLCGIGADTIRRLARELAAAPTAAVYGRTGTCTQEFGTITSWLVDVLNVLTGNLDRPGGAMFPKPAAGGPNTLGAPRYGRETRIGRWRSRVRGLPESFGELPVACLAEEIETPGEGQVRALITIAGNPALSAPNSGRLQRTLASLELLVCVDFYVNETTGHADVILPPPSPLERGHYDLGFYLFALRNVANYSPPVFPLEPGQLDEWQILAKLAMAAQGLGADADPALADDAAIRELVGRAVADPHSPFHGRTTDEVLAELTPRIGPERILDFMLRAGPYRLALDTLLEHPHGVDLGPLQPRLPEVLRTPSGMVELAPQLLVADVERLRASLGRTHDRDEGILVLIGRRHLRSNNSWMHNIGTLVKGKARCTLQVNPADAGRIGLEDGGAARVSSPAGTLVAPVELTDAVAPGVVSLPHGWGHDLPGVAMAVAQAHAGVNANLLADDGRYDELSGNAVLNGIPVQVAPAGSDLPA
ncbi:MAG TPA: molybdopterin oxidoreductase family protein [Geminicoccaceae bacterium]|nr:molybdopterin oxidoreductase family protein [Geminicoccaceae bacterium]